MKIEMKIEMRLETMPEYIERDVVLKELNRNSITKTITFSDGVSIYDMIKELPTADVVEVKHGKWIKDKNRYTCSECGFYYFANNSKSNYCPNCGAKMDKE